jgi:DNA-binding transcriptional MerR regulator
VSGRSYLSIGDVLTLLRQEFPDITISKIRFLESQGLVNPERTPSGYRKFYEHDVERLRWVLRQQREHFLPLKVIKDRLDDGTADSGDAIESNGNQVEEAVDVEEATTETPASGVSIEAIDAHVHAAEAAEVAEVAQGEPGPTDQPAPVTRTTHTERSGGPDPAPRRQPEPVLVGQAAVRAPGSPVSDAPRTGAGGAGLPGLEGAPDGPSSASARPTSSMQGPAEGPSRRPAAERSSSTGPAPTEAPSPARMRASSAEPASEGASEGASEPTPTGAGAGARGGSGSPSVAGGTTSPEGRPVDLTGASFTLAELAAASGLDEDVLEQLGEYGLLSATQVGGVAYFNEDGLAIANLAAGFARYGVEPRHLRLYKNTADREAGFIEQIVLPLVRQRNPEARQRAGRTADELTQLGQGLRGALLRNAIRDLLGG